MMTHRKANGNLALSFILILALAALLEAACSGCRCAPYERPNIVLVSIDTLRADRLSLYGHKRRTSPSIDRFAKTGVVFENALSQAPWTLPSAASFTTSRYPSEHGAFEIRKHIRKHLKTIAEVVRASGYQTIGVVSHDLVGRKYGFAKGFDVFDESQIRNQRSITSWGLVETSLRILRKRKTKKPFFLWIHLFDPHFDYIRHPEYRYADETQGKLAEELVRYRYSAGDPERMYKKTEQKSLFLKHIMAVYDEEIRYTDEWLGKFFKALEEMELSENTVTIITADHGEYFMERGRFLHDGDVYKELVHVPLIIGGAVDDDIQGKSVKRTVELVSLPATIAVLAGIERHPFRGENLLELADRNPEPRYAFSEGTWAWKKDGRTACAVYDGWKLVLSFDTGRYELYHSRQDKNEKTDLWKSERADAKKMKAKLKPRLEQHVKDKMGAAVKTSTVELSEKEKARLKALGYLQ